MVMIWTIRSGMVTTRKPHRCYDCGHVIPKGTRCWSETLEDGHIYGLWYHEDCRRASAQYCKSNPDPAYDYDGVPPLREMVWGGGDQVELDAMRGHFPHVVTRIEFWIQERP
jgi:hypothetical protein